jgi:cytochrome P450
MADTLADPGPFIPETVTPPEKPLPLVRGLLQMIANPLYVWPKAMYENPYHGVRWIGRTFHYFRRPEHMKAVFLDHADIFRKSQFQKKLVGPALGDGLLTSEGEHWKFQRRAASPAFRIDHLRALVPAFSTAAQAAVERMKAGPKGATIDVIGEMQHATLDVIVETILGGADPGFEYGRIKTTVEDYMQVMGKPDMLDMVGAPPSLPRPWGGKGRRAASALTLTFALYLIANAPDVQDRLLREVLDVAGDRPIDAAMVDQLVFHEQVVKESMRLYPPVSIIDRLATEDIDLGDAKVKKGDFAFCLIYIMHRHKMLWDHPERFDPDRFSEERAKGMHRFQSIPFGAGPRICIGMKFAYMEAVAILATLVRSLKFRPNPAHRVEPNIRITLRPEGGMPLHVESRQL